jgi:hypothetical protein
MTPHEAAEKIRPSFRLYDMPPEDRHHVKFVEAVADELGIEHTAFNLHQVDEALDAAGIHEDIHDYPKWVEPNPSRVEHIDDQVFVKGFDDIHVERLTKKVTVLVDNEDEEKLATSAHSEPAPLPDHDPPPSDHDKLTGIGAGNVGVARPEDAVKKVPM